MIRALLNIRSVDDLRNFALTVPDPVTVWNGFVDTLRNPGFDPARTATTFGTMAILMAIVVVLVMYFILRFKENREINKELKDFEKDFVEKYPEQKKILRDARVQAKFTIIALSLAGFFLLLFGLNVASSNDFACKSCHVENVHFDLAEGLPHADKNCVSCHEGPGYIATTFTHFAPRIAHFIRGSEAVSTSGSAVNMLGSIETTSVVVQATSRPKDFVADVHADTYGGATTGSCFKCHKEIMDGVIRNDATGIKVKHDDFLNQGTPCMNCHGLDENSGTITMHAGMSVCITCHDGKTATADCAKCHTKDIGHAAASRSIKAERKTLVTDYDCYKCHQPKSCDSCHGTRLPHSEEFMTTSLHAYEGAKSIWAGKAGKCVPCHNEDRRSCNEKCHGQLPYHVKEVKDFPALHPDGRWETTGTSMACSDCHGGLVTKKGSNVCDACHAGKGAQ